MARKSAKDQSKNEASYWHKQIDTAERDNRYRKWLKTGQDYYDRYLLESSNLDFGYHSDVGVKRRNVYNLLWSNVQTQMPMLYSRLPEPYVTRRFGNRDPVARMAATISERATSTDLESDDLDDHATACVQDYLIVGRGVLRVIYEASIVNSRITVRQEDVEDGEPLFITEAGETIPGDAVEKDKRGMFTLDPRVVNERAPIQYHFWKDFLIGPGRNWSEVKKRGWIDWICFMTKADVARRFGDDVADQLAYTYNPFNLQGDEETNKRAPDAQNKQSDSLLKLARVDEVWDAKTKQIFWVSKGYDQLLDKQLDPLELQDFFNTPRPLLATTGNHNLTPVPDYAEYRSQASEMDQITSKIEQIVEEIRAGGCYDQAVPNLGTALRNKNGGWHGVDNWSAFASSGGMQGAVQDYDNLTKINTVAALYQHRDATKRDADEIAGIIDLFRGQQTQKDETLGQSEIRTATGGLRVNDKQRDFQRYLADVLNIKLEIIVSQFDDSRILEMADGQALIEESPNVARLKLMAESPQGQQALQTFQGQVQFQMMREQAVAQQTALIQAALALLREDRMRTFRLNIETDSTAALDENMEKQQAGEFVEVIGNFLDRVFASDAVEKNPELKALSAEMLMFVVRKFKIGRSLEQKIESVVQNMVTAPPPQQQPDPLTMDVMRQTEKDKADVAIDQQKNQIDMFKAQTDRFEAATDRMDVEVDAVDAARDANREDLKTAADIIGGIAGNA